MDGWKDQSDRDGGFPALDTAALFIICNPQVPVEASAVVCECLCLLEVVAKKIRCRFMKLVSIPNPAFYLQPCDTGLANTVWAAWRRKPWVHAVRQKLGTCFCSPFCQQHTQQQLLSLGSLDCSILFSSFFEAPLISAELSAPARQCLLCSGLVGSKGSFPTPKFFPPLSLPCGASCFWKLSLYYPPQGPFLRFPPFNIYLGNSLIDDNYFTLHLSVK